MGALSKLPNIGGVMEKRLNAVDIFTKEDLESVGSKEAYLRLRQRDPSV